MGLEAGTALLALQGIQAAAGLTSSLSAGQAIRAQGKYEEDIARENAALAELAARQAEKRGAEAAQLRRREGHALIARQRAAAAGQGLVVGEGTAGQLEQDAAADTAEDAEAIRLDAMREAFGFRVQATNDRALGRAARIASRGQAAQTAATGGLQFGRDLLQGVALHETFKRIPEAEPPAREAYRNFKPDGKVPASTFRFGTRRKP